MCIGEDDSVIDDKYRLDFSDEKSDAENKNDIISDDLDFDDGKKSQKKCR